VESDCDCRKYVKDICVCSEMYMCIVVQMINKAHDDWVTGLILIPGSNHLLSCCRGGLLKVWNIDNCALVGDVHAHNSPINALATNSQLLFAASKYEFFFIQSQHSDFQWLANTVYYCCIRILC